MKIQVLKIGLVVLCALLVALPTGASEGDGVQEGLPTRRSGGGRRGFDSVMYTTVTALIPEHRPGLTLMAKPTLYFYLPKVETAQAIEWVVRDQNDRFLYGTLFGPDQQGGIRAIDFSQLQDAPELAVNQSYHWYLSIIVDPQNRAQDVVLEGWIQRVSPDPELAQQLASAAPLDQARLYADHGLWYDSLQKVAQLRQEQPEDPAIAHYWQQLLGSVGLNEIAFAPWVDQSPSQFLANAQFEPFFQEP